jgi:hypothetical protein
MLGTRRKYAKGIAEKKPPRKKGKGRQRQKLIVKHLDNSEHLW